MGGRKWTTVPELLAYLVVHVAGIISIRAISPIMFRLMLDGGYRESLVAATLALQLIIMIIVLCAFLVMRVVLSESQRR